MDSKTRIKRRRVARDVTSIAREESPAHQLDTSNGDLKDITVSPESPESSDESLDSDDFEDVELEDDAAFLLPLLPQEGEDKEPENEVLTFSLAQDTPEQTKKRREIKRFPVISKEERQQRKLIHKTYLVAMMAHAHVRNRWCNSKSLQQFLRRGVPRPIVTQLHPETGAQLAAKAVKDVVYSRRFLDGVRDLMLYYKKRFKISSKGLIYKNWHELSLRQRYTLKNVDFPKFSGLIERLKGSRDIGAQGFLCLARSLNLTARLVYSIQAPDVTLIASKESLKAADEKSKTNTPTMTPEPEPEPQHESSSNVFHDRKDKLLEEIGGHKQLEYHPPDSVLFEDSSYPIFWVEIWNKYTKKWLSVDPIVLHIVEVSPMRRKSKFEVPLRETRNHLAYALAFDSEGGVIDVTRRYCQYFNAKIVKKRIESRSEEDAEWYRHAVRAANTPKRKDQLTNLDIIELKEFRERDLAEGMPPNITDFKDHPVYALEHQLRQNEVIYPKDGSSTCGKYRIRGKENGRMVDKVLTVYKRSHVYDLKSAKAWYLRGRVLKIGVQPLKVKQKTPSKMEEDPDDDGMTRLYAQFQTQLFIPPPITNGQIPRNAYGNIDVYTPSMIPENGFLVSVEDTDYTVKQMVEAARILEIDYAKAVVNFDFKNRKSNKMPTVKEGGIVVDVRFKEGILAILENIKEQDEEAKRKLVEEIALKNWKFFLTKLRIQSRLDREHGRIDDDKAGTGYVASIESPTAIISDDEEEYENEGGFMMEDNQLDAYSIHSENSESEIESGKEENKTPPKRKYNTRNHANRPRYVEEDDSDYYDRMEKIGMELRKEELLAETGDDSNSEGGGFIVEDSPDTIGSDTAKVNRKTSESDITGPITVTQAGKSPVSIADILNDYSALSSEDEKQENVIQHSDTEGGFLLEDYSEDVAEGFVDAGYDEAQRTTSTGSIGSKQTENDPATGLANEESEKEDTFEKEVSEETGIRGIDPSYATTHSEDIEVINLDLDEGSDSAHESSPQTEAREAEPEVVEISSPHEEDIASSPEVILLDEDEERELQHEEQMYDFDYSESE